MAKKRDYKAEYERRKATGEARGISLSQARGHPKPGELPIGRRTAKSQGYTRQLESGVQEIRRGKPLSKAAKAIAVSPERLRKYVKHTGVATKAGRQWRIGPDKRNRVLPIFSGGRLQIITVANFAEASHGARFMSAVNQFLDTNDESFLNGFIGDSVVDVRGRRYYFETGRNVLYRLNASQTETFEEIYRIVV
jgi:hypothetical protein